jgi:hypothetical protein
MQESVSTGYGQQRKFFARFRGHSLNKILNTLMIAAVLSSAAAFAEDTLRVASSESK